MNQVDTVVRHLGIRGRHAAQFDVDRSPGAAVRVRSGHKFQKFSEVAVGDDAVGLHGEIALDIHGLRLSPDLSSIGCLYGRRDPDAFNHTAKFHLHVEDVFLTGRNGDWFALDRIEAVCGDSDLVSPRLNGKEVVSVSIRCGLVFGAGGLIDDSNASVRHTSLIGTGHLPGEPSGLHDSR